MDKLLGLLKANSFERRRVILTSGRESDFFIDCKQTVLRAEGHLLAAEVMLKKIGELPVTPQAVAGVELGGCPLASAVATHSARGAHPLDAVYVRKQAKSHGSGKAVEGATHLPPGAKVVVLEDVMTTGTSTLSAVASLRAAGLEVIAVIALVDRLEGGAEALRAASLPFYAIYTRNDFMGSADAS